MRMELPVRRWAAAGRTMPTHGVGATGIKQCVVATKQACEYLCELQLLGLGQSIEVIDLAPRQQ